MVVGIHQKWLLNIVMNCIRQQRGKDFPFTTSGCANIRNWALVLLSNFLVTTSKTARPFKPVGGKCMGPCKIVWSAVCPVLAHLKIGKEKNPICASTTNSSTAVSIQMSHTLEG